MSYCVSSVDLRCLLMNRLPPDLAKRLLSRDLANLAQRIHNGGKLNPSEKALLEGIAASPDFSATVAENFVALAGILGVTRRSLQRWRKRRDAPQPMNSGFHDVSAWQEFMRRHGLKGGGSHRRGDSPASAQAACRGGRTGDALVGPEKPLRQSKGSPGGLGEHVGSCGWIVPPKV